MEQKTAQKIFFGWFVLLTTIAIYNFIHNISDSRKQAELMLEYENNKGRYEHSISEHNDFKGQHEYLRGRLDSLENVRCKED